MRKSDWEALPETGAAKTAKAGAGRISGTGGSVLINREPPRPGSGKRSVRAGWKNEEKQEPPRPGKQSVQTGRKGGENREPPRPGSGKSPARAGWKDGESWEPPRPDYRRYRLTARESLKYLAMYAALDACVSTLFFSSGRIFLILLPGAILFIRVQKRSLLEKRRRKVTAQFLDAIQLMLAALQAGYSSENAVHETRKELRKIYNAEAMIVREFDYMDAQLGMSRNLEELFLDFARRSGSEDIVSFAEVLMTAKRTGGDLISVIRNTVSCIRQKQETLQEIETCLAGKVMEQNIMSMVPLLILAYIRLSSPEYLDALYHSEAGILVMTICFAVFILAYLWGRRIVKIEI